MKDSRPISEDDLALLDQSFTLEEQGQHDQALVVREALAVRNPSSERIIIALAKTLAALGRPKDAEHFHRKAIFVCPYSELASLQLFHFLLDGSRSDDAFIEMQRFQSISHSDDYDEFVRIINFDEDRSSTA